MTKLKKKFYLLIFFLTLNTTQASINHAEFYKNFKKTLLNEAVIHLKNEGIFTGNQADIKDTSSCKNLFNNHGFTRNLNLSSYDDEKTKKSLNNQLEKKEKNLKDNYEGSATLLCCIESICIKCYKKGSIAKKITNGLSSFLTNEHKKNTGY